MQERIFKKFFDVAETANLSKEEYAKYWESEKVYYDMDGAFRTASSKGFERGMTKGLAKGRAEGRAEEKLTVARQMKELGLSQEMIAQVTGLTTEEINKL